MRKGPAVVMLPGDEIIEITEEPTMVTCRRVRKVSKRLVL